jgi:predicted DNA-binding protein with PD1-like motif
VLTGTVGKISFTRFNEEDDLIESLKKAVGEENIRAGAFFVIGALKHVVMGHYKDRKYKMIELDGQFEIASCTGNIALDEEGQMIIHAHMVVSNEKGETFGGHLFKGSRVGPTAELVTFEAKGPRLLKVYDKKTNLKLLKLR